MSKVVTQLQTLQVDELTGRDGGATNIPVVAAGTVAATGAVTLGNATALLKDGSGDILFATGTTVPVDTTTGYAKGCLFIDTDVATGTTGLNCNKGTNTSCVFTAVTQA